MAETVACPDCQRKLLVPEELLGKLVQCPGCGKVFTAMLGAPPPGEAPTAPPAAELPVLPPPERPRVDWLGEEEDEHHPLRRRARRDAEPHRGVLILVLGILSLVVCGFLGPFAWVMGHTDLRTMRLGRMDREGEGLTQAGLICGIIGTVLGVLELCLAGLICLGILGDILN
jgi:hypothetical protein